MIIMDDSRVGFQPKECLNSVCLKKVKLKSNFNIDSILKQYHFDTY